eukprot:CAMPEP_0118716674 /NCGR_PEP_ID=MMETSP0800-20121206/27633_1 /TAXON_ID=210618 ORGANISM="Striatella unipunctata, Strain CCMP2910" /NCGR_SAMPLE_ID=MMETSP0800 /ASSEMBLY_ACC=CAM_ASM_000638 /LENGTH=86 /DNA_ID=CAMNT_0006623123 /DNA_START=20 /DNA_END=277 /DNA_ORIENTATION=+
MKDMFGCLIRWKKLSPEGAHDRLYEYYPALQRMSLLMASLQLRSLYDSIVWKDDATYLFHHAATFVTAWPLLHPGVSQYYSIYFIG